MESYTVYKHTSPSGKVYIGITKLGVERRWQGGRNYKTSTHFNNAIAKYGWDNIKHEVLYDGLSREDAENKEIELIKKYDSTNPEKGYNIERGGNTPKMSEETRAKISKALKGRKCPDRRKHTEEEKRAISEKLKGRKSPMKGRHWSVEQRAAVGAAIVCVNTGEEFYSIREASRVTGCDRSNIARVLKGEYSQTRGVKFEYKR